MKTGNYVAACFFVLLGALVWGLTKDFPTETGNIPGPAFFPRLLVVVLEILVVMMLLESRRHQVDESIMNVKSPGFQRAMVLLGVSVVYTFLLNFVGFLLLTPICLFLMMLIMEKGRYVLKSVASVSATILLYLVFEVFLTVPLPAWSL